MDEDVLNAIDNYYKLKNLYEGKINKYKNKNDYFKGLTKKDRRLKMMEFKKKCIKCKKDGGTIFSRQNRTLKAICGSSNPCSLDIEILLGNYVLRDEIINNYKNELDITKINIIQTKLNILFNYITENEGIKIFEKERDNLRIISEKYTTLLTDILLITNNPEKLVELEKTEILLYENIQYLKNLLNNFNKEDNLEYIKEAIELYKIKILPIIKLIRNLKYSYISVENNILIEKPYTLQQMEFPLENDKAKIIKNNY